MNKTNVLQLVVNNGNNVPNNSSKKTDVVKKVDDILINPSNYIEENMSEKIASILEEAIEKFLEKYPEIDLDIHTWQMEEIEQEMEFTSGVIIDIVDLIYVDNNLSVNYYQYSTVSHYIEHEYNEEQYKQIIIEKLGDIFIKKSEFINYDFPLQNIKLSQEQEQGCRESVDQIIAERIKLAHQKYNKEDIENKLQEINKVVPDLYKMSYIALFVALNIEESYDLIMDNHYLYGLIERMIDYQQVFIELSDNIPETF